MPTINVDGKPVPKQSFRMGKGGGFTDPKVKAYQNKVKEHFKVLRPECKSDVAFEVWITEFRPVPKSFSKAKKQKAWDGDLMPLTRPDVDNLGKSILDAANGVIWKDDSQVTKLTLRKMYSLAEGLHYVEVTWCEV